MGRLRSAAVLLALLIGVTATAEEQLRLRIGQQNTSSGSSGGLLSVSDLTRQGAFRPPVGTDWVSISGGASYRPSSDSIFGLSGFYGYYASEISVPSLSMSTTYASLTAATELQAQRPAFEGRIDELRDAGSVGQMSGTGIFVSGTTLLISGIAYYNDGRPAYSHFTRSTTLSSGVLSQGPMVVTSSLGAAFGAGPMADIPSAYQAALGNKTILSGLGPAPIITRTSQGPALFSWNVAEAVSGQASVLTNTAQTGASTTITLNSGASAVDNAYRYDVIAVTSGTGAGQNRIVTSYSGSTKIATVAPAWDTPPNNTSVFSVYPYIANYPLAYYTASHPTLGTYQGTCGPTVDYCTTDVVGGIAFLAGSRTVAVFGQHTVSSTYAGYGTGTSTLALHGTPVGDGSNYVYDPLDPSKGEHGYPYVAWVWLYDVNDLALSVAGGDPWAVEPYESGPLTAMDTAYPANYKPYVWAATYDPAGKRIFIVASGGTGGHAVIHVYTHP